MGTWGAELYQDDIAQDVRERFKNQLSTGKTAEQATEELFKRFAAAINNPDDAPVFWFALADTQWDMACLLPSVKKEALERLANGGDIARWAEEDPEQASVRRKVLEELEQKLSSQSPLKRKARDSS